MKQQSSRSRVNAGPLLLVILAIGTSGIFKLAAFAREAFIAAHFGLSSVTDAYFGLQQFPMILATYMFGSFSLAFAPAYATARKDDAGAAWLPGILAVGTLAAIGITLAFDFWSATILACLHFSGTPEVQLTLRILSLSFAPIVWIGVWAGICTAAGQNLWSIAMTGFPFLGMVVFLFGLSAFGKLNNLSLPISMAAGFVLIGLYSLFRTVSSHWRLFNRRCLALLARPDGRKFLRELGSASIENVGYSANQILLLFFLSRCGTGFISANNCAMRIGMLVFTVVGMPLAQLVQAKLCVASHVDQLSVFRKWFMAVCGCITGFALVLLFLAKPIIAAVYLHGKFRYNDAAMVAQFLPAWVAYVTVMCGNALLSRYLFVQLRGAIYTQRQLLAYGIANLLRLSLAGMLNAPLIIWCSVVAECCSMALNMHSCLRQRRDEVIWRGPVQEVA